MPQPTPIPDRREPPAHARLVIGPPAERLAEGLAAYTEALRRRGPFPRGTLGGCLWVAATRESAAAVRRGLVCRPGAATPEPSATLEPGVRTLRRTIEALTAAPGSEPLLALDTPQRRRLIAELVRERAAAARGGADPDRASDPLAAVAGSPGLVDYLLGRIAEVRGLDLSQEEASRLLRSEGPVGAATERLLQAYQRRLAKKDLADDQRRIRTAIDWLARSDERLELLVVERRAVRTPLEARLIGALAARAERVLILSGGRAPGRSEEDRSLDPVAEATAAEGEALWGPPGSARGAPPAPIALPRRARPQGLEAIAAGLFSEEAGAAPGEAFARGVEIVVADSPLDEARRLARRVKRLLLEGIDAAEIVVTARRLGPERAQRLADALRDAAVPALVGPAPRWGDAPAAALVRCALRVATGDWEHYDLLELIGRPELRFLDRPDPVFGTVRVAAERFLRDLQAPAGRDTTLGSARAALRRRESRAGVPERVEGRRSRDAAGAAALAALEALAAALGALPEAATPLAWRDALGVLLATLTGRHASRDRSPYDGPPNDGSLQEGAPVDGDSPAWRTLSRSLASLEGMALWSGDPAPALTRREVAELVEEWATRLPLGAPRDEAGHIRVVPAETAVGLDCRWLLAVGLDETSFAAAADRDPRAAKPADPMLLFYDLVTAPQDGVWLSYVGRDEKGQPVEPSPFLAELERVAGPTPPAPEAAVGGDEPLGRSDALEAAAAAATHGDAAPLARLIAADDDTGRALLDGLVAIHQRRRGDEFGAWEGMLVSEAARRSLAAHNDDRRFWSASQLETYGTCPFQYFAKYELGIAPPGDLELEFDHRRLGELVHNALSAVHQRLRDAAGASSAGAPEPAAIAAMLEEELHRAHAAATLPPHAASIASIELRRALQWAERYGAQHEKHRAEMTKKGFPLAPRLLEARFGPAAGTGSQEDPASTDEPLRLELPGGGVALVTGRIDRVDACEIGGRTAFTVIDYKTGALSRGKEADVESGRRLQPVLYALAAQSLLLGRPDAVVVDAGYWGMRERQGGGGAGFASVTGDALATLEGGTPTPTDAWRRIVALVARRAERTIESVRGGVFPPSNPDPRCGAYCDYRTVCRVQQARALGKGTPPTSAAEGAPSTGPAPEGPSA